MNLLEKAIKLAVEAHAGQVDKSGRPYILHPLRLMLEMETEEEMITAVLHDVIEDTHITLDTLRKMGFPEKILTALELLTHETADTPYDTYILTLKTNPIARRVKLADLAHNMDIRRLPEITTKDCGRLAKYRRAWKLLNNQ
ncbi:MAG: HD domain-containing protein [Chloroflexi bacterium]|nr:MAG: HD domain-containing protein [Chloroflexota bacterium]